MKKIIKILATLAILICIGFSNTLPVNAADPITNMEDGDNIKIKVWYKDKNGNWTFNKTWFLNTLTGEVLAKGGYDTTINKSDYLKIVSAAPNGYGITSEGIYVATNSNGDPNWKPTGDPTRSLVSMSTSCNLGDGYSNDYIPYSLTGDRDGTLYLCPTNLKYILDCNGINHDNCENKVIHLLVYTGIKPYQYAFELMDESNTKKVNTISFTIEDSKLNLPTKYNFTGNNAAYNTKNGYYISGWKNSSNNNTIDISELPSSYAAIKILFPYKNVTTLKIYPIISKETYKINYILDGASISSSAPTTYQINDTVEIPVPTKKCSTFNENLEFNTWMENKVTKKNGKYYLDTSKGGDVYLQPDFWSHQMYYTLYLDMILNDSMKKQFSDTKEILVQTKTRTNEVFDISAELLNFLITNKDSWKLEEGEIRFQTDALYNQYNLYVFRLSQ